MGGAAFLVYIEQVLTRRHLVIMPAGAQTGSGPSGDRAIRCRVALPAALPARLNPIENAFAKLKAFLRKAAARTRDDLWSAIASAIPGFRARECRNYFVASGYEPV
jgi:hypothetical protein